MIQHFSIGIGCSSRATSEDVIGLIEYCVGKVPLDCVVATLDRCSKVGEVVAMTLGVRLVLFPASILAQVSGIKSYSSVASEKVGTPSVAEASALASLGSMARLILPRQTGRFCTCAVAVVP